MSDPCSASVIDDDDQKARNTQINCRNYLTNLEAELTAIISQEDQTSHVDTEVKLHDNPYTARIQTGSTAAGATNRNNARSQHHHKTTSLPEPR